MSLASIARVKENDSSGKPAIASGLDGCVGVPPPALSPVANYAHRFWIELESDDVGNGKECLSELDQRSAEIFACIVCGCDSRSAEPHMPGKYLRGALIEFTETSLRQFPTSYFPIQSRNDDA